MPNDLTCTTCEKEGLNASTMKVHEKSKAHLNYVSKLIEFPESLWDEKTEIKDGIFTVRNILEGGTSDPIRCARLLRKVFSVNHWPGRKQPKSVRTVLEEAGIPIFDAGARTLTEGEVRKNRREQLALYQEQF